MLRMSKMADYAFILLSCMALKEKDIWSAGALADEACLPKPTVSKLLKKLSKGRVVTACRGANGGYRLTATAKDITIAHIIEAVDGPIRLTNCVESADKGGCSCGLARCPVRGGWEKINSALRQALNGVLLSDLMPPQHPPLWER